MRPLFKEITVITNPPLFLIVKEEFSRTRLVSKSLLQDNFIFRVNNLVHKVTCNQRNFSVNGKTTS